MTWPWIAAFVAVSAVVTVMAIVVLGTVKRLVAAMTREGAPRPWSLIARPARGWMPSSVPEFIATTTHGATLTGQDLADAVVLFLDRRCQACDILVSELEAGRIPALDQRIVVVVGRADAERLGDSRVDVLIDDDFRTLALAFASDRVPDAYVIAGGRVVDRGTPNDWFGLRDLAIRAKSIATLP
jgi:hypothetical protein